MKQYLILSNKGILYEHSKEWYERNAEYLRKDGGRLATDEEIDQFLKNNEHIKDNFIRSNEEKKPKTKKQPLKEPLVVSEKDDK